MRNSGTLVYCIFRQVGHRVARRIADAQYQAARVQPKATLAEHLEEFEKLWSWMTKQWQAELSDVERENFVASWNGDRTRPIPDTEELCTKCGDKRPSRLPFPNPTCRRSPWRFISAREQTPAALR